MLLSYREATIKWESFTAEHNDDAVPDLFKSEADSSEEKLTYSLMSRLTLEKLL